MRLWRLIRLLIEDGKQPRTQSLFANFWTLAQMQEVARKSMEDAYLVHRRMIS